MVPWLRGAVMACEVAAAAPCVLFAIALVPGVFRHAPPDAAGLLFRQFARTFLGLAFVLVTSASAMRLLASETLLGSALDGAAALCLAMALASVGALLRARDRALREPGPGAPVDGVATLRAHALLSGIRALALLAAALAATSAFAMRDRP